MEDTRISKVLCDVIVEHALQCKRKGDMQAGKKETSNLNR